MVKHEIKKSIKEPCKMDIQRSHHSAPGGGLPEGWCILVDDVGDQLTDDEGLILVALCTP